MTPANEVNNLVGIASLHGSLLPGRARQDIAIPLNRNSLRCNSKMREKLHDVHGLGYFPRLAINHNLNYHLHGNVQGVGQDLTSGGVGFALERNA